MRHHTTVGESEDNASSGGVLLRNPRSQKEGTLTKAENRVEKLLALLLVQQMKDAPQRDKSVQLSAAGLTNMEIAELLQTTAAVVSQQLYEARRKPAKKPKRPKTPR